MNRRDLITKAAALLRTAGIRKNVTFPKKYFFISDDQGNTKKFPVAMGDKDVMFTAEDVSYVLDALMSAIEDSIQHGDPVNIKNFGTISLAYKKEKDVLDLNNKGEMIHIPGRYVPKFVFGNGLRFAAKTYSESVRDMVTMESKRPDKEIIEEAYHGGED